MRALKVVLATDKEYSDKYESILSKLYERKVESFCIRGRHCAGWEEAMDAYLTDPKRIDIGNHIVTTSHEDEPFEDVMNMAELWLVENGNNSVEVIRL